jgi:hypothetical protein
VKAALLWAKGDIRGLKALVERLGKRWLRGAILYTGTEVLPFASNLRRLTLPLVEDTKVDHRGQAGSGFRRGQRSAACQTRRRSCRRRGAQHSLHWATRFREVDDCETNPVHSAAAHLARGDRDDKGSQRLWIAERRTPVCDGAAVSQSSRVAEIGRRNVLVAFISATSIAISFYKPRASFFRRARRTKRSPVWVDRRSVDCFRRFASVVDFCSFCAMRSRRLQIRYFSDLSIWTAAARSFVTRHSAARASKASITRRQTHICGTRT